VNESILVITRFLRIVRTTPLHDVFPGENPYLADCAWSANGQFCVLTSTTGNVGLIARNGVSLMHRICDLAPFTGRELSIPLKVCADTRDPSAFLIYSREKMRRLLIKVQLIEQTMDNLISLPFPMRNCEPLFLPTVKSINSLDLGSPFDLVKLLYYAEIYKLFGFGARFAPFCSITSAILCIRYLHLENIQSATSWFATLFNSHMKQVQSTKQLWSS
jgi:hypothetical protein